MDTSTPAVVLGLARNHFQHGSLGIIRSLGRLGVPMYALLSDVDTPASSSRYLTDVVGLTSSTEEDLLAALRSLGERAGGRAVLYPTDDVASGFVTRQQRELGGFFLFAEQDASLVDSLANKLEMAQLCAEHSVPTPAVTVPVSKDEVAVFAAASGYPVVVKAIDAAVSQAASGTSVAIAADERELFDAFEKMSGQAEGNVMLQEYIPGGPENVWMFNGYFDRTSRCAIGFTGRKLRQWPPYTGMTSLGECRSRPVVRETSIRFLEAVGYRGPVDLGMRYDERDGLYKMLDINPRMGATFRLFVGPRGMDVARAMYLDLTVQTLDGTDDPREGRKWFVEHFDIASSLTYLKDGRLRPWGWFASFRGIREGAWFARDDLTPFLKMLFDSFLMATRWVWRRLRSRR